MKAIGITAERLRAILHYDPETGVWTWSVRPHGRSHIRPGDRAGGPNNWGYWRIKIGQKAYQAHRLAWLYMTGDWPPRDVDHADLDKANCRWANLRLATPSQNHANVEPSIANTSGIKGVSYNKRHKKWRVFCCKDGVNEYVGAFSSKEEAATAYAKRAREMHGEYARAPRSVRC